MIGVPSSSRWRTTECWRWEGRHERAARLYGATEALAKAVGARCRRTIAEDFHRALALCKAALCEAAFAAPWAEGRALTLEQAVEYVLQPGG